MRRALPLLLLVVWSAPARAQHLADARDGVRLSSRALALELRDGLAVASVRVTVVHDGPGVAEARLRVPVPPGAGLAGLRACLGGRCRRGRPDSVGAYRTGRRGRRFERAPLAHAARERRGRAAPSSLSVAIAPLPSGDPFEVELRWVAPTRTALGVTRLELPAPDGPPRRRGRSPWHVRPPGHPSVAGSLRPRGRSTGADGSDRERPPLALAIAGPGLEETAVNGSARASVDGREALRIEARIAPGRRDVFAASLRCGDRRCLRYRVAAGPAPAPTRDVFLLLDASPSARHVDPARRTRALTALLDALAPDSRVVRVAYGREVRTLDPTPRAPAAIEADAPLPHLGNQTRLDAAWARIEAAVTRGRDPLVVLVGDGALTPTAQNRAAVRALRRSGAELSVVHLAPRRWDPFLRGAVAGSPGEAVDATRLDAVRRLAAPVVEPAVRLGGASLGPLRAGEEIVVSRTVEGGRAPVLRAFGDRRRPRAPRTSAVRDGLAVAAAPGDPRAALTAAAPMHFELARKDRPATLGAARPPRLARRVSRLVCGLPVCRLQVRGTASREALDRMRARFRPRVRDCFARARRGRPRWRGAATVAVTLEYGEILRVRVEGATDPRLARCLATVTDALGDVPWTDGAVLARFPFRSEARPSPPAVPLAPDVEALLERALEG
ncbi:MAG TPA: hypothetical protein RMH99_14200 [Sandaracinaceae bacterium LLY-WYZ-13_1]|nr:hypothetical protein [Sandaracinaceae bacterium LLY-WYZ-13_1]